MEFESEFKSIYDSILNSFDQRIVPSLNETLVHFVSNQDLSVDYDLNSARIMVSSWIEFLNNLFITGSSESLLSNLNNHLNFIKRLDDKSRDIHLRYFKNIFEKLFLYIIQQKMTITVNFEIEEDYRIFELDVYLFDRELDLENLVIYILSRNYQEINETTENHIRGVVRGIKFHNDQALRSHLDQLKAIQETVLTILQMDRKEQQNILIRKLQKEFDLINLFYFLVRKITDNKWYQVHNSQDFEFKTSYDYPFLDVLKTMSKWYQKQDHKYLQNAQQIVNFIKSRKPFRKEDKEFLRILIILIDLSIPYQRLLLTNEDIPNIREKVTPEFCESAKKILTFFLNLILDGSLTLLYKRKMFVYLTIIIKAWIKNGVIEPEHSRKVMLDVLQLDRHLKKQPLKKMGRFKKMNFQMTPRFFLEEFEKGMGTQLLYALEDFTDWKEGKEIREYVSSSNLRNDPRFRIMENLYKISNEIIDFSGNDSPSDDLVIIKKGMIDTFFTKILKENFVLLPQPLQLLYSGLIIQTINLAFEAGKISEEERSELLGKLSQIESQKFKGMNLPLLHFNNSQLFSEDYEKMFSSVVTLLHLYLPIAHL